MPQDTPSCCAAQVEKPRDASQCETETSRMPTNSPNSLAHFGVDVDSAFDELTDPEHWTHEFDEIHSYPSPQGEDTFQQLGDVYTYASPEGGDAIQRPVTEMQSHALTPESMSYDFDPLAPRERTTASMTWIQPLSNSPVIADPNHEAIDFHMQNTVQTLMSYPNESSNSRLGSNVGFSQDTHRGGHSTGSVFEWPSVFGPMPLQHQQQSHGSEVTNMSSSPTTPDMRMTISLEGVDPSTVSAVIGVLIESKAKFRFETH